jgi:CopG family transcriptional regulator/antitoxin EndoAI
VYNKRKEEITFTLPDYIISEVDHIVKMENSNRADFAKAAFQFYITQKKKIDFKECMIKGYKEMGQINLSLAELGMTNEVSSMDSKEEKIAQGEY